ncbi:MAG: hypoxanthine phosphoribosyltransferase [Eubacteriaceae bacterium]|nr:hypoxanthine phosphoribosyltransferase [Eubacteriaceae bacterium]
MTINNDIKEIFLTEEEIQNRVSEIAADLEKKYEGRNPLVICVLKGGAMFMMDIVKHMNIPLEIDFMAVQSYAGTQSQGVVKILKDLDTDISDRDIIVVEDILDTGITLDYLIGLLRQRNPKSVCVCALLVKEKKDPSVQLRNYTIDYEGFTIRDEFVVGYGLDYNQSYRNLPYIGVLKEEVYNK